MLYASSRSDEMTQRRQTSPGKKQIDPRNSRKLLVVTGATSGIGRRLIERILAQYEDWTINVLARPSLHSHELRRLGPPDRLAVFDVDLRSLQSVNRACDGLIGTLGSQKIDALALNAGVQSVRQDAASIDGIEVNFAVNFLAHFLIARRLKDYVRPEGRIVITSSEMHDPNAFCLLRIRRATWQDPLLLSDPVRSQQNIASTVGRGEARYCASKLPNLMHLRHLAREAPTPTVIAFNPSVVPGTNLARDRDWPQRMGWQYIMRALVPIIPLARSLERSAGDLLWLLTAPDVRRLSGSYIDGRSKQPGSPESRDQAKIAHAMEVANQLISDRLTAQCTDRD
jgi:NAD(P)-dependent dehydrogenase (short-subunit alcohol dehydrogenase family)